MTIDSSKILRSALQATIKHCNLSSGWVPSTKCDDDNRTSVLGHYIAEHWALALSLPAKDTMLFCSKRNFTTVLRVPRAARGHVWDYSLAAKDFSSIYAAAEIEMGKTNYRGNNETLGDLDGLERDFVKLVYAHVPARAFVARVQSDRWNDRLELYAARLLKRVSPGAAPGFIDIFLLPTADSYIRTLYGRVDIARRQQTRWQRPLHQI